MHCSSSMCDPECWPGGGRALLPEHVRPPMSERRRNFAGNVCLAVSLAVWLALIIPGHALRVMVHPTGELPLWYEISTCANASDAVTVSGYGGEPASTSLATEAYTRSYWIQHGRIPSPYEFAGSACPIVAREPGPFDITLEKDDGYRRPEHG